MNGDYTRGLFRRMAAMFRGTVVADAGGGDFTVRLDDTQGLVTATPLFAGAQLKAGQKVLISRTDSMGRGLGGGYSIHGSAPSVSKGTSGARDLSDDEERGGATISLIEPASLTLEAGGASATITIYGTGLADIVPTYGHAEITDASAQVVTDTQITLDVEASITCPLSTQSLTIGEVEVPNYFSVIEMPSQLLGGVWHQDVLDSSELTGGWGQVHRSNLRSGDSALGPYDDWADDYSAWGGIVYISDEDKILALVGPMDSDLDEPVDVGLVVSAQLGVSSFALPFNGAWGGNALYKFGKVYYIKFLNVGGFGDALISMDPDGTNGASHAVTGHNEGLFNLFNDPFEDNVVWLSGQNISSGVNCYVMRLTFSDPATFAVDKVAVASSSISSAIAVTSSYVYAPHDTDRTITRISKSDLSVTTHAYTGSGTWETQGCLATGGYLYVVAWNGSNSLTIFKVDESTMSSVASAQLSTSFKASTTMLLRDSEIIISGSDGTFVVQLADLSSVTHNDVGGHQLVVL